MSIARTSSGRRLLLLTRSIPSSICRTYSATTKASPKKLKTPSLPPSTNGSRQPPNRDRTRTGPKPIRFYIPPSNDHLSMSGKLNTTPDVWAFLQETGIEYNNSKATRLNLGADERKVQQLFNCLIQYTPQYILHPYHLQHLRPGGTPMLPQIMSKYRRKLEEQPLWTYTLCRGGGSNVIRNMMVKRLTGAFWAAMEELGYSMNGPRGTLIVTIHEPLKVAQAPAHIFGEAVAKQVKRTWNEHMLLEQTPRPGLERPEKPTPERTERRKPKIQW